MKKNQTQFMKLCLADSFIKLMARQKYETISVNEICELSGIGRTTYYRHFKNKNNKEELLCFKIIYEWEQYVMLHPQDVSIDKGYALLNFIYDNRNLLSLLYKQNLISTIMRAFEQIFIDNETYEKDLSYIMSFFTYGYWGIIYQWLRYDFTETPSEVKKHIDNAISSASNNL